MTSFSELVPINDLMRWDSSDFRDVMSGVTGVAQSGYFMRGPLTSAFEEQLSRMLNGMKVVSVGNGTDALTLSLLGLGVAKGDKVVTVANAGGYATGAILRVGATPVFVDVDQGSAQMSSSHLSETIIRHGDIKAIVVTHLYGLMADIKSICDLAKKDNILVIEDCAQSIGAKLNNIPAGSWGDASTFSFYPTKNLACLGDGGAVALKQTAATERVRRLAQYGWSERYVISEENGVNSRLDEIQAAVLLSRVNRLEHNNKIRLSIIRRYANALSEPRRMIWDDSESYVGHLAVMVSSRRDYDKQQLDAAKIGHSIHYPVLDHRQPSWAERFRSVSLPNSELLAGSVITLPCFPLMTEDEIIRVCDTLHSL